MLDFFRIFVAELLKAGKTLAIQKKNCFMTDYNGDLQFDSTGNVIIGCQTDATNVQIPDNVTDIDEGVFSHCVNIEAFIVADGNTKFKAVDGVLYSKSGSLLISYPAADKSKAFCIPDGVMLIGRNAFMHCCNLVSVSLSDCVRIIGEHAFDGCTNLAEVKMPAELRSIGSKAFANCPSLVDAIVPDGVDNVAADAFDVDFAKRKADVTTIETDTSELEEDTEVTIDDVVYSADGTTLLRVNPTWKGSILVVPNSIRNIAEKAFSECQLLKKIYFPSSHLESVGNHAFDGCVGLEEITLPVGLKSIGDFAFANCTNLRIVVLPITITHIGDGAFSDCKMLSEMSFLVIDPYMVEIHEKAFSGIGDCTLITHSDFALKECQKNDVFGVFKDFITQKNWLENEIPDRTRRTGNSESPLTFDKTGSIVMKCDKDATEVIVPEGIKRIEAHAFSGCTKLTSVILPETLTVIADSAFSGCEALESIVFPEGLERLGMFSFDECKSLRYVVLPATLTEIEMKTFYACESLISVEIPENVKSISTMAFGRCSSLKEVHLKHSDAKNLKIVKDALCDVEGCTLYVPADALESFREHRRFPKIFKSIKAESTLGGIFAFFRKLWK